MRFEQITATVVRNFAIVEARANFVVTSVLAAASRLSDWLRKPLGTPTSLGLHDPSQMYLLIQRILHAIDGVSSIGDSSNQLGGKRWLMPSCPAMVCASSPGRARREGVASY